MNAPSPRSLRRYVTKCLGLEAYLRQPGDGRPRPRIPARTLLWSMLIVRLLREISFLADGQRYTGRVEENRMIGRAEGGAQDWLATRSST